MKEQIDKEEIETLREQIYLETYESWHTAIRFTDENGVQRTFWFWRDNVNGGGDFKEL